MGNLVLAIDLGGTQLRAALVDEAGLIVARDAVRTDSVGGPDAVIGQLVDLAEQLIASRPQDKVKLAGVSCPGPLDTRSGRTFAIATLPGYDGFPFAERASARLGMPVVLEHDGHAAAYGEWRHGAGRGIDDFVYLTISTGLGGGAIVNGRLLRGAGGMACHVGHMTVNPDGPLCGCGNRGCWEMMASGTSFLTRVRYRAHLKSHAILGNSPNEIEAVDVFKSARTGDAFAIECVEEEARWLGIGMINLIHLFNPARIVIGGGMSNNLDMLLPGIVSRIDRHAMPPYRGISIVKADLGDNAGLIGIALLTSEANAVSRYISG